MLFNGKHIHEVEFFLIVRALIWDLANDLHICKKYEKPTKHVILSNLI